jgi:hypothetical protein
MLDGDRPRTIRDGCISITLRLLAVAQRLSNSNAAIYHRTDPDTPVQATVFGTRIEMFNNLSAGDFP